MTPKFPLGRIAATPDFLQLVPRPPMIESLKRHAQADHGDIRPDEAQDNAQAIADGNGRVFSAYYHAGFRFYVVTSPDRSVTTFLMDYEL